MSSVPGISSKNLFLGAGNGFSRIPFALNPVPDLVEYEYENPDGTLSSEAPLTIVRQQAAELNYLWQGYQGGPNSVNENVQGQGNRKYTSRLDYQKYMAIKGNRRGWTSEVSDNTQSYGLPRFTRDARPPVVILNGENQRDVRGSVFTRFSAFNGLSKVDDIFTYGSYDQAQARNPEKSGFSGFLARDAKLSYSSATYRGPGNRGVRVPYYQYSEIWSRKPPSRRFIAQSVDPPFIEQETVEMLFCGLTMIPYWVRRNTEEGQDPPPFLKMVVGRGGLGTP